MDSLNYTPVLTLVLCWVSTRFLQLPDMQVSRMKQLFLPSAQIGSLAWAIITRYTGKLDQIMNSLAPHPMTLGMFMQALLTQAAIFNSGGTDTL